MLSRRTLFRFGNWKRNCGNDHVMFKRLLNAKSVRCWSLAREGEIVPERKFPPVSGMSIEIVVTLLSRLQKIEFHAQQSVPFFHVLRIPEGSSAIPDLKARRPTSSSG